MSGTEAPNSPRIPEVLRYKPTALGPPLIPGYAGNPILFNRSAWPVKDEGARGTCVAFAVAALYEYDLNQLDAFGNITQFSQQFLYWALKTEAKANDPSHYEPNTEWARLINGANALQNQGICRSDIWRYDMTRQTDELMAGAPPDAAALADAALNKRAIGTYILEDPTTHYIPNAAGQLHDLLVNNQKPVAIIIQTFTHPTQKPIDNWKTSQGLKRGVVDDPNLATYEPSGGHCVCVVGMARSADNTKDFFIVRNSWSTLWGQGLFPHPSGIPLPQPGYGLVSASYIDSCCKEFLQLA